jgi:YcxB-like protein
LIFMSHQVKTQSKHLAEPRTLGLSPNFLHARNNQEDNKTRWKFVKSITMTDTHLFILFDNQTGHVIPKHAVTNEEEAVVFFEKAKAYWKASQNHFV